MGCFEATTDFSDALTEVDILIQAAASNNNDPKTQGAMTKASILLLTAKLEAFIEQVTQDFCYAISQLRLRSEQLPKTFRIHASRRLLNAEMLKDLDQNNEAKIVPCMESLALLWSKGCTPAEVEVDCSFAYGKHGEKAIRRLFQRVGIEDVFSECMIMETREVLDETECQAFSSVAPDVNTLTGYRNYIIHNDGFPNTTYQEIERFRERLFAFAEKVDEHLARLKRSIQEAPVAS